MAHAHKSLPNFSSGAGLGNHKGAADAFGGVIQYYSVHYSSNKTLRSNDSIVAPRCSASPILGLALTTAELPAAGNAAGAPPRVLTASTPPANELPSMGHVAAAMAK